MTDKEMVFTETLDLDLLKQCKEENKMLVYFVPEVVGFTTVERYTEHYNLPVSLHLFTFIVPEGTSVEAWKAQVIATRVHDNWVHPVGIQREKLSTLEVNCDTNSSRD